MYKEWKGIKLKGTVQQREFLKKKICFQTIGNLPPPFFFCLADHAAQYGSSIESRIILFKWHTSSVK